MSILLCFSSVVPAGAADGGSAKEDGYDLWLRYRQVSSAKMLKQYRKQVKSVLMEGESPVLQSAREELVRGLEGLLANEIPVLDSLSGEGCVIAGTPRSSALVRSLELNASLQPLGREGFLIRSAEVDGRRCTVIAANEDAGVLYGVFHFLRLLQTHQKIGDLHIASAPKVQRRILDHWDNLTPQPLTGSIERGYAGDTLWKWDELPGKVDARMKDYARANASIGINGTVLSNVNSDARILTEEYLRKAAALADAFRPYGIRVYLSARFSAPREIGGLDTADPVDPAVIAWWKAKTDEIYRLIPDFGGFLVKANSEGQPGPQDYKRSHAQGANMLARTLAPHDGIVMWRAFVYGFNLDPDRVKQAYEVFVPLDGKFDPNVMVQVKNGPLDFQPREPVHPLFGAMPRTPLMMELQITQEYLGQSKYLAYLAPMWKEVLTFDTFAKGEGSTVAKIVDGSLDDQPISGIAGVANTGSDRNWCGHHFAQANWYSFGRLAWDHELDAKAIAEEWARMTFGNEKPVVNTVVAMMMNSWEGVVNTMTPLGLAILHGGSHYGPAPESRAGYHHADAAGLGYDRSRSGSDAVDQYHAPQSDLFDDQAKCPEKYLLWFHHVKWDHKMKSGRTLWEELCERYEAGAANAAKQRETWESLRGRIDAQRFDEVEERLKIQERDAAVWRDICTKYFAKFSHMQK